MLVYGERAETVAPRKGLRALTATLKQAEETPAGPARHDVLVSAYIHAAGLAQGLADAEFEAKGYDDISPPQEAAATLLLALGKKVAASAWSDFASSGPPVALELMGLALQPHPDRISVKRPEGYAYYAVYPEAYLRAGIQQRFETPPLVIGLRSIGLGLAGLVGVAASAKTVISLRPVGPPFARELMVSDALLAKLSTHTGAFAVVDEGPGLSGSSFGAVGDLLERLGVAPDRIVYFPSHPGDLGPEASPAHRARWADAQKTVVTFEDLATETPLASWFDQLTGEVEHIEELSGGGWREAAGFEPAEWPPVNAAQERLKFRLHTATGRWLAKFAGLGAIGPGKLERAEALHRAGFSPEPLALRRGFLLERWETGTPGARLPREEVVAHLGAYLGFRASAFPAQPQDGAATPELIEMIRVNAGELLGEAMGQALARQAESLEAQALKPAPVHIDGRLHPWEWMVSADGLLLKTDAIDHSDAHDLVGCQDIAWDVAGAAVEFDLSPEEVAQVCAGVEAVSARPVDPSLLAFYAIAYPAFQAGYWSFARASAPPQEQLRIDAHADRYTRRLAQLAAEAESAD